MLLNTTVVALVREAVRRSVASHSAAEWCGRVDEHCPRVHSMLSCAGVLREF
jgi:hypothetical protein